MTPLILMYAVLDVSETNKMFRHLSTQNYWSFQQYNIYKNLKLSRRLNAMKSYWAISRELQPNVSETVSASIIRFDMIDKATVAISLLTEKHGAPEVSRRYKYSGQSYLLSNQPWWWRQRMSPKRYFVTHIYKTDPNKDFTYKLCVTMY
jgi:hypothetical protein